MKQKQMNWTGERYTPGSIDGDITIEHNHRYLIAQEFIKDRNLTVLDIASGEGYGSSMLSKYASKVYGVDISEEAINFAKEKYQSKNIDFLTGSCSHIPLSDKSIDVAVSFETIEHHTEHDEMMMEIRRVLKDDGVFIISSPDKKNFSEISKGLNHFHVKELFSGEFKSLLSKYFLHTQVYGQRLISGSLILNEDLQNKMQTFKETQGTLEYNLASWDKNSIYHIAIASNYKLESLPNSVLESDWMLNKIHEFNNKATNLELENKLLQNNIRTIESSWIFLLQKKIIEFKTILKKIIFRI